MQNVSSELEAVIRIAQESMARTKAHESGRVEDRRVAQAAIEHAERRKGPRRMAEKRAMLLFNVEID